MIEQEERKEIPFEGDTPFESQGEEQERVAQIVRRDLVGYQLDKEHISTCPEPKRVSYTSPPLDDLQKLYGLTQGGENPPEQPPRMRIFRSYRIVATDADINSEDRDVRHAHIAFRRFEGGTVEGVVYGYEA
jgi:hypothetical protein